MIPTVVGYAGFKSYGQITDIILKQYRDKPYSQLKPAQPLERDYYSTATREFPDGKKVLQNFGRFDTVYRGTNLSSAQPGKYQVPVKNANTMLQYEYAHKPELYPLTSQGKQMAESRKWKQENYNPNMTNRPSTEHWKSSYQGINEDTTSKAPIRSVRPEWSLPRQAYSSQRTFFVTENMRSYGTYGSKPQEKINPDSDRLENQHHELTVGTTKTTSHIPGYNGFLPRTDLNEKALAQSLGLNTRETIIKQNIVENYNLKVPGYSGHKPMSALNDRGLLRPQCLSTKGESFK